MTSATSEQEVRTTSIPESTGDSAVSELQACTACNEAEAKRKIAAGIRYESEMEVIYKDGCPWNLTRENLLAASPRQAIMWMLLLDSTEDEDDNRTIELLAESLEMFSYNITFVRELLDYFHPALDE
jgi:hypothetical protein